MSRTAYPGSIHAAPGQQIRTKGRRLLWVGAGTAAAICVVAAAALVLTGVMRWNGHASVASRYEGPGFATSDDAVTAYMTAMTKSNIDGMLKSFAIETFAQHFSLKDDIGRLRSYNWDPEEPWTFPTGSVNQRLATYQRVGAVTSFVVSQYAVLSGWNIDAIEKNGGVIGAQTSTEVDTLYDKLFKTFDGSAFSGVKHWRIIPLADVDSKAFEFYQSSFSQKLLSLYRSSVGASAINDFAVSISSLKGDFILTGETARYGDRWWILNFPGSFGPQVGVQAMDGGLKAEN